MPPSVAGSTLSHVVRQATTKRHFEQLEMQFPAGCCTNITWRMGTPTLLLVVRAGALSRAASLPQISEMTRELFPCAGARDHPSGRDRRRHPSSVNGKGSKTEPRPDRAESGEQHLSRR